MKTEDSQEVQIDLLMAFVHFRLHCGQTAKNQKRLEQHQVDARFEQDLERLNRILRIWWKGYKQNWANVVPVADLGSR
jgi:hypothetical protein